MGLSLEQVISRLEDPGTPVIWLDPSLPEDLWDHLPGAVRGQGYRVLHVDESEPVRDLPTLLESFGRIATLPEHYRRDLPSLKESLLRLPDDAGKGWVVIFRHPEALRQHDEVAFEDFLEILELVHESRYEVHEQVFKLIVRD